MISIIVAVDKNNNIGKDGDMLFMLPSYIDKLSSSLEEKNLLEENINVTCNINQIVENIKTNKKKRTFICLVHIFY